MERPIVFLTSTLSCWPLGWGITELLRSSGNPKVAAWCCLASAAVALIGLWGLYLIRR